MSRISSYISPKLEGREITTKGGHGVFALEMISRGEILAVWGGDIYTKQELAALSREAISLGLQIEADLYIVPEVTGAADWFNHSCNPNAGIRGQVTLVAVREISVGEEICFDYAMTDSTPYDEFICECGSTNCRYCITGDDWQIPELWERYEGYFATYLWQRIRDKLGQ